MLTAGLDRRRLFALTLILTTLLIGISGAQTAVPARFQNISTEAGTPSVLQNVPITEYPIPLQNAGPLSIAEAPDGSFWIAEFSGGSIAHFLPSNGTFRQFQIPEAQALPAYVTLDRFGRVWFSDQSGAGSIWMFDPGSGNFTKHPTTTVFSYPVGVAIDAKNNVWFAEDSGNNLGELVYPSFSIKEFPLPQAGSGPAELAIQSGPASPTIWLTESLGNRIAMFNTTTNTFKEFSPNVPFASPVGIVLDKAGRVWVSEHGGSSIVEFDPGTSAFTYFPSSPPPVATGYPNSAPATLAIDGQGRLWFVEHFSNKVGRLDPTTRSIDEFQIPSTGVYSVLSAIDSKGNFWFTEFSANKIGTISANASLPFTMRALPPPSTSLSAGQSVMEGFRVANNGTTAITLQLYATSTFSQGGSSGTTLNLTTLSLQPGKSATLLASVSPDPGLAPGSYAVGVAGQDGNMSTVGVLVLQVTSNATNVLLYQTLPDLLTVLLIVLALANAYVWFVRRSDVRESEPGFSDRRLVLWLGILFTVLLLSLKTVPVAVSKCPGLPGIGSSSSGPNYVGIIIDVVQIAGTAILAYFLVKGLLQDRKERRRRVN
jgi:streptogramin lyase